MDKLTKRQIIIACTLATLCDLPWFGASAQLGDDSRDPQKLMQWAADFDEGRRPWCVQLGGKTVIGSQIPDSLHFIVEPDGTTEMFFQGDQTRLISAKVITTGTVFIDLHEDTWRQVETGQVEQLRQATALAVVGQQTISDGQWVQRTVQDAELTFKRLSTLLFGGSNELPSVWGVRTSGDKVAIINSGISLQVGCASAARYTINLLDRFPAQGLRALE